MKRYNKFLTLALASVLALTPISVYADEPDDDQGQNESSIVKTVPSVTPETVDESKTGSITLVKQLDPTSQWIKANGLAGEGLPKLVPIQNIGFSAVKIADISTYAYNGEIGTYYTNLNEDFLALLNLQNYALVPDKTDETKNYYTATTLADALSVINKSQTTVEQFVDSSANKISFAKTNAYGETVVDELPLGLYLIAETDVADAEVNGHWLTGDDTYIKALQSSNTDLSNVTIYGDDGDIFKNVESKKITISSKTVPYLISIPTTNTATITIDDINYDAGTVWQYDVVSYPKNTGTSVTKMLIDQDDGTTLRTREDYEVGDKIHQVIFSDVSGLRNDKKHEHYTIKDTMSNSLTFDGVLKVTYGKRTVNPETTEDFKGFTLFDEADYVVTSNTDVVLKDENGDDYTCNQFSVDFTESGLAKLDALDDEYLVVVYFDTTLNSKAKIGTEKQNMNQPELEWWNTYEDHYKIVGNKIYVFTYEIDITKDGLNDPTKANFKVKHVDDNGNIIGDDIVFVEEESGLYHLFDNALDKEEDAVDIIHPDDKGNLYVKGVDSEKYAIVEVSTQSGHNLLKHEFTIVITAPEKDDASLNNPNQTSFRDGTVEAVVNTIDDTVKEPQIKTVQLQTENGIIYLTLINNDVVTLHTGGSGTLWYYMISMALISAMGLLLVKKKREDF